MNVSFDRSVLGSKNHLMSKARPTMIDLLMIVVHWLAGFRRGGGASAGPASFLPPARAVCPARGGSDRRLGEFLDIGWMTVRLDSLSCVRVLSGSSSARRDPTACCTTPHYGGA
jgi:hypothetical protein